MLTQDMNEVQCDGTGNYSLGTKLAGVKSLNHLGCALMFMHCGSFVSNNATGASLITTCMGVLSLSLLDMRRYQLTLMLATLVTGWLSGAGAFLAAGTYLATVGFGYAINRGIEFKAWKRLEVQHG